MTVVPMTVPEATPTFNDFWTLWPKRVARMEAEKAWKRLEDAQRVEALVGLVDWRSVWLSEGRLQFVPNASTWLNQQRWSDELPANWGAGHLSHLPAKLPDHVRSVMPQHVKDAIARLRGRS